MNGGMGESMLIKSMADNDFYKFTMMQAVLHNYPGATVEYKFKCRTEGIDFNLYVEQIRRAIIELSFLKFQNDELDYFNQVPYFTSDFIQFLKLFKFDPSYVYMCEVNDKGELLLRIRGPWVHTILYEVPILAIISEILSIENPTNHADITDKLFMKTKDLPCGFEFADFGTRRRHSYVVQDKIIEFLTTDPHFIGTSNVHFAMKYGVKFIGTQAHEWFQAHQQLGVRLADFQKAALDCWAREYRGHLGIALTDVIGLNSFLEDFDLYFAKLFDGTRQDSGCPYEFGEKMIRHYRKLHIEPMTKSLVFSDGLTFRRAVEIFNTFSTRINTSYGIGTHLTNDVGAKKAPQIVIKMIECNNGPVCKISDSPGKGMCEQYNYVDYVKGVFSVQT